MADRVNRDKGCRAMRLAGWPARQNAGRYATILQDFIVSAPLVAALEFCIFLKEGLISMKLYFSPGACSLSPHIVLCEAGLAYELEKVDLASKLTAGGADFRVVNPKGYVPALQLDGGEVLTEVPAIVQYLADRVPEKALAPAAGSIERYRVMEWLNFISTELHKNYSPLFHQDTPQETRQRAQQNLNKRLELVAQQLQASPYLTGESFCVADSYLFVVLRWSRYVKLDLSPWPQFQDYMSRMKDRPAVHRAMQEEGLIKA